jgi:hypothetical protein
MANPLLFDGEDEFFKRLIGRSASTNLVMKLYSNERVPGKSDTITEFTEVTGGGYAAIEILEADWSIDNSTGVTILSVTKNFHFTGVVAVVYGVYLTNLAGTKIIDAFALTDAPVAIGGGGGDIEVTFNIKLNL